MAAAVCNFDTLEGAVNTVIETFLDEVQIDAINRYSKLDYPLKPTLFLEFHGTEKGVAEQAEMVGELAAENGGGDFKWSDKEEEKNKLWRARHDACLRLQSITPRRGYVGDRCLCSCFAPCRMYFGNPKGY
ncbi:putative D-lactate dehydrogenase, mitochondrial [Nymphon striatum]|nr:putative D-lactate dehydrogenase, mitochondrial [Nymphon striatum]